MALRILVVGPSLLYPWVDPVTHAFTRLGHAAASFSHGNIWMHRLTAPWIAAGRGSGPRALVDVRGGPEWLKRGCAMWREALDRSLIRTAQRMRPDLILVLRGELIAPETLAQLKRAARGPTVSWWIDDPWLYLSSMERLAAFDAVFIYDRHYVRLLQQAGIAQARFLPCACDETVYAPQVLRPAERARYRADIALVAWFYPNRGALVRALAGCGLGVWGREWDSPQARQCLNGASRVIRGTRRVEGAEVAKIYSAASIGLNIHFSGREYDAGLNKRSFELLATGTFELVDAIPGMDELLVPGQEVVAYRSPEEARDLARYYLAHPDAREAIAVRGRERVLREHTYAHRMRQLLQQVMP